jgi:hypothetical protein
MLVKQEGSDRGLQESKLENYATFTTFYPKIYYLITFAGAQWFLGLILYLVLLPFHGIFSVGLITIPKILAD